VQSVQQAFVGQPIGGLEGTVRASYTANGTQTIPLPGVDVWAQNVADGAGYLPRLCVNQRQQRRLHHPQGRRHRAHGRDDTLLQDGARSFEERGSIWVRSWACLGGARSRSARLPESRLTPASSRPHRLALAGDVAFPHSATHQVTPALSIDVVRGCHPEVPSGEIVHPWHDARLTLPPETGVECVSSARSDLRGGDPSRPAWRRRSIPTATNRSAALDPRDPGTATQVERAKRERPLRPDDFYLLTARTR
jgi:hypothetical protein